MLDANVSIEELKSNSLDANATIEQLRSHIKQQDEYLQQVKVYADYEYVMENILVLINSLMYSKNIMDKIGHIYVDFKNIIHLLVNTKIKDLTIF